MNPQTTIEYPKLNKIGGLKNFTKHFLIKATIIVFVATLAGYLGGHIMQKNFRELTGYSPTRNAVMTTETEQDKKQGTSITIKSVTEAVRDKTTEFAYRAIDPPLRAMDWAAFWLPFVLVFIGAAWLTNKLFTLKTQVLSNGMDPQVIKNMEILEAKVKELVDRTNTDASIRQSPHPPTNHRFNNAQSNKSSKNKVAKNML